MLTASDQIQETLSFFGLTLSSSEIALVSALYRYVRPKHSAEELALRICSVKLPWPERDDEESKLAIARHLVSVLDEGYFCDTWEHDSAHTDS